MRPKRLIAYIILSVSLLSTTSCIEFKPKDNARPRVIKGTLFTNCEDSLPMANKELILEYKEFISTITQSATTDSSGKFTFKFDAEDWHEGGMYGPYFAELQDAENGRLIIAGIKPEHSEIGNIFYNQERYIQIFYEIDLTSLLPDDSLSVKGEHSYSYFLPSNGIGMDTALCALRGKETLLITPFSYAGWLQWRVYNSDTLRLWGTHIAPLDNACQDFVKTELVID